jgi:hypothetical protein
MLATPEVELYHSYHVHAGYHYFEWRRIGDKWSTRFRYEPEKWVDIEAKMEGVKDGDGCYWLSCGKETVKLVPMHISKEWKGKPYPVYVSRKDDRYTPFPINYKLPEPVTPEVIVGGEA